jgi:hypothetical protein
MASASSAAPQKIVSGPFKGYYYFPNTVTDEVFEVTSLVGEHAEMEGELRKAAGGRGLVWYKYSPGPGKNIQGFSLKALPYVDGYYYIPHDPSIDLRKHLYVLENKLVPWSGNTETFNLELAKVRVPRDYCPAFLDPCDESWCVEDCAPALKPLLSSSASKPRPNWYYITGFSAVIALLMAFFIVYG